MGFARPGAESPGHGAGELHGDAHGHRSNCCLASDRWERWVGDRLLLPIFVGQIPHFNGLGVIFVGQTVLENIITSPISGF